MQQEICILSRGGQGAVTAAKILVGAALLEGTYGQMVPNFGQERKGAPVFTYARLSREPILTHTYVYKPNIVVLFDPSLTEQGISPLEGLVPPGTLVVNAPSVGNLPYCDRFGRVGVLDAYAVTREILGNVPPNAAMLGAFVKTVDFLSIDALEKAVLEAMPGERGRKNAQCARVAYERTVLKDGS